MSSVDGPCILPTGTCFDDALDFMGWVLTADRHRGLRLILVHAICVVPEGPNKGEFFAHAWVEERTHGGEWACWQDGLLHGERLSFAVTRESLLENLRPTEMKRYTVRQAHEENERSGTYGPWEPRYQALCGRARVFRP